MIDLRGITSFSIHWFGGLSEEKELYNMLAEVTADVHKGFNEAHFIAVDKNLLIVSVKR